MSLAPGLWIIFNCPVECSLLLLLIVLWQVVSTPWISSSGLAYGTVVCYVDKLAKLEMGLWDVALVAIADSWCDRCDDGHFVRRALLFLLQLLRMRTRDAAHRG